MIINGTNNELVNYFSLKEYVDNIQIEKNLLEHMEETNVNFDKYLAHLFSYDAASIKFLMKTLSEEYSRSQEIENHYVKNRDIEPELLDKKNMSNKRIHNLHNYVMKEEKNYKSTFEFRNVPVRVSKFTYNKETIFWHAAKPEDINRFMDDFLSIYRGNATSVIRTNPFLNSALMHLLFMRIHPYIDGNGRTARMIHNIKFTESINRIYGSKLEVSPLNLSASILINKPTYAKKIDNIYFDLEHETNKEINSWFNFILNMIDEQIYYNNNRLDFCSDYLHEIKDQCNLELKQKADDMKIKKLMY